MPETISQDTDPVRFHFDGHRRGLGSRQCDGRPGMRSHSVRQPYTAERELVTSRGGSGTSTFRLVEHSEL
jgi:hypothetical protein